MRTLLEKTKAVRRQVLFSEEEKRSHMKIKFNIAYYIAKKRWHL